MNVQILIVEQSIQNSSNTIITTHFMCIIINNKLMGVNLLETEVSKIEDVEAEVTQTNFINLKKQKS